MLKLAENENDSRVGAAPASATRAARPSTKYLVADTSFGASQFCRSFGGYYRLDTDDARSFLDDYVAVP